MQIVYTANYLHHSLSVLYTICLQMDTQDEIFKHLPIGRHLTVLSKHYVGVLTKKLEGLDIERHFSLLLILHYKPDCNQKCLAEILDIDKTSLVGIIDFLSEKGYVKREINPKDRREYFIRLTAKAKKNIPLIIEAVQSTNEVALSGFSENEIKSFYKILFGAYNNLEKEPVNDYLIQFTKLPNKKNEK